MAEVSFGEWLKRRRGAEGWTQGQLAQKINCSTSALRKMESEERRPSPQVIEQLADIFTIPQDERKAFSRFARGDWQAIEAGGAEQAPWRVSTVAPRSNLSAPMKSFIGREKERDEIITLISNNRLVTLAGDGGIGKTQLSFQVGQKLLNEYPDGIWFISLDSLSNPALIPQTVASIFDLRGGPDRPITEVLIHVLRGKTLLFILDNCEHLLDACAELINALLTNCPKIKILTTSREILNMDGEATYYLPSLSMPEESTPLEKLGKFESIQLFVERATLASSTFRITGENAHVILDICRRVNGIPLAIELTAARVNILKVEEISNQLRKSFAFLAGARRATLPRHQTLQASLEWSWSLLTNSEQVFMHQLSVFAGGWTLEAAQTVCDGDTLTLTSALVNKSLILADQTTDRETRYRFHEIVRHYAREKLIESGKEENLQTRHLKYFLQLTEQAEPELRGPSQTDWMSRLIEERDNLRTALTWAAETDLESGMHITARLHRYWEGFDMREGEHWLVKFIEDTKSMAFPIARAKVLLVYGRILEGRQKFTRAHPVAQECLDLCRACSDLRGEIDALLLMGSVEFTLNSEKIVEFNRKALNLAQSLGDIWRQAMALHQLGWNYTGFERFSYWERAITLFRDVGDWSSLTGLLSEFANFAMLDGNFELAEKRLDEAARLNDQLMDKTAMLGFLGARGHLAMIRGDYKEARLYIHQDHEIAEELGNRVASLWSLTLLGYITLWEGNFTEAYDIFAETSQSFNKDQSAIGIAFSLEGLAGYHIAFDRPDIAARLVGWADATREKFGNPRPLVEQTDVDKIIQACISKLGDDKFSDAYEEGKRMTLEKAVEYALEKS